MWSSTLARDGVKCSIWLANSGVDRSESIGLVCNLEKSGHQRKKTSSSHSPEGLKPTEKQLELSSGAGCKTQ